MARRDLDEWLWQVGAELQRLSEEMAPAATPKVARRAAWEPRVDLLETTEGFLLKVEIAGVKGDEIRVSYQPKRHSVTVRGVRHEDQASEFGQCGYHQLEINYGEFAREIRLPEAAVAPERIRASYQNGFLVVIIPRAEEEADRVTVRRTIRITQY